MKNNFVKYRNLWILYVFLSCITSVVAKGGQPGRNDQVDTPDQDDELFCAVLNPLTGSYIDLSQLSSTPNNSKDDDKQRKAPMLTRWLVKGWNYEQPDTYKNFTLSICSSPITEKNYDEIRLSNWTGAYYHDNVTDTYLSIGDFSTKPVLLGDSNVSNKKLTLKYENGSRCPNRRDRKSTIINFTCDKDVKGNTQINFIGSLNDCSYFFEVKSIYACPTSNKKNEVNVIGIFFAIFIVFFLVEVIRRRMMKFISTNKYFANTPTSVYENIPERSHYYQPRWEVVENEPLVNRILKNIFHRFSTNPNSRETRKGTKNFPRSRNDNISQIRLSTTTNASQDSFMRDMEAQNNILDNLEIDNASSETPPSSSPPPPTSSQQE